ncbi:MULTISPECIES: GspH/FimT family pseudopilin [Pseudoalteromonas]|uniref:GspH/FimT family pseudopilin n=1 Tax=Pseudoalteromonas TaxID=53246 RepID=UPI001AD6F5DB|nr:GspH/FimT family pseudopilin [Pseudoalteromonas sp. K222D]MBO7925793.1 GspH/FimT family pseudopilin [Pseudoalteromonas sp. K222D]
MKKIQYGFTLLELMVTVAIVGIIATIALWNSSDMLEENRAENFLLELKRNISYARSQAATNDEIVVVCPAPNNEVKTSNDKLACQSDWGSTNMIILFVDIDNDGEYGKLPDNLLRVMAAIPANDTLNYTGNINNLSFNTSGRITTSPGDFIYCPNSDNKNNKVLTVSQSGTAFYLGDGDGTHECLLK